MLSMLVVMRDAVLALALGWLGISFAPQQEPPAAGGCSSGAAGVSCADTAVGWGGNTECQKAR